MIQFILTYLDGIAPIIPLSLLVIRYSTIQIKGKAYILGYFLISFVGYMTAAYIGDHGGNNLRLYNILPLFLFADLFVFFRIIHTRTALHKLNIALVLVILLVYMMSFDYVLAPSSFASLYYILFSIFILTNALGFYYTEFRDIKDIAIWKKSEFWFITCLLFYASISMVIWGFFKILIDKALELEITEREMRYIGDLWKLHNVVFFVACVTFFLSLLWKRSKITY